MKKVVPSGMLAGILNGFCYMGSMLSNYGLGTVADYFGWSAVFWLLFICLVGAVVLGCVFVLIQKIIEKKNA